MYDYWKDVSYGTISLEGSNVFGWYDMQYSFADNYSIHRSTLMDEARRLAKENDVNYEYIMVVVNANVDGGAITGRKEIVVPIGGTWGQTKWRQCTQCRQLVLVDGSPAGTCPSGGHHVTSGWIYSLARNIPGFSPSESNWRYCKNCNGICYDTGVCRAGGKHDRTDSGIYSLTTGDVPKRMKGDPNWKRCIKCQSLVYTLANGPCFAGGGSHDYAPQNYWIIGVEDSWMNAMNITYGAHEMGHAYGLGHANLDPENLDYGDRWDIMGASQFSYGPDKGGVVFGNADSGLIAPSGESGPGLSSANLDRLGWMPKERIRTYDPSEGQMTIKLTALNRPNLDGFLMAKIVTPDRAYTVEFRQKTGWDKGLPRDVVLIHYNPASVDSKNALIVSASSSADEWTRRTEADWKVGQKFIDSTRDVIIAIDDIDSSSSRATVTLGKPSLVLKPEVDGSRMTVQSNTDGRLEALLLASPRPDGTANDVWHNWQTAAGSSAWSGWQPLLADRGEFRAITRGIDISVTSNADGRLEAFAIGMESDFWHNWQTAPGSNTWSGWQQLGVPSNKGKRIIVERNADGRLEAFAIGMESDFWHNWQTTPGSNTWSGWKMLGVPSNKGIYISAASNADGRLEVAAMGTANLCHPDRPKPPGGTTDIYHNWQTAPGGGSTHTQWSGWQPL